MSGIILYTDGAARGNPGPAAIGVVIADNRGRILKELGEPIGTATNNEAEYRALLRGLELAKECGAKQIEIRSDSELLTLQLRGAYRVRAANLRPLYDQARRALGQFGKVAIRHIPRRQNARADHLANQALDRDRSASHPLEKVDPLRSGMFGKEPR